MKPFDLAELAHTLFEASGDALFLFDPDNERILVVNPMAQQLTGFSRSELAGLAIVDLVRSADPSEMERLRRACRENSSLPAGQGFLLRRRDQEAWLAVDLAVNRLLTKAGTVGLLTARDSTERHRAQAIIDKQQADLLRLLESVPAGLWTAELDGDDRWVSSYASPGVQRILGHTPEFFLRGHEARLSTVHPEDRAGMNAVFLRLLARQSQAESCEYRALRADGSVRWVRLSMTAGPRAHQSGLRLDGVLLDVTERRRAEETLREQEDLYRQMFVNNQAVKLLIEPRTGAIVDANPAAAAFYGYPLERLKQMRIGEINMLPPEQIAREMNRTRRERRAYYVFPHRLASGQIRTVEVHTGTVQQQGRTLLFSIIHDVTERHEMEESLRVNEARLHALLESLPFEVWASDAQHTFLLQNSTFQCHWGNQVGRRLEDAGFPPDLTARWLETNRRALSGEAVQAEVQHLLAGQERTFVSIVSPIREGRAIRGTVGVNIDVTERKLAEKARRTSEAKYRSLLENLEQCVFQKDRDFRFVAVNRPLCQALGRTEAEIVGRTDFDLFPIELAQKYRSDDQRVLLEGQRLEVEEQGLFAGESRTIRTVKTPVKDDQGRVVGVHGIFWDASETPARQPRELDSLVVASADQGERATSTTKATPDTAPASPAEPGRGGETILLVDDEPLLRQLGKTILERFGYQVLLAADGLEAVEIFGRERDHIALVILDLTMPRLSGKDAFQKMRGIDPHVRVLFSSGYSAAQLGDLGNGQGIGFVRKPYRPADLAQLIRTTLDQAPPSR